MSVKHVQPRITMTLWMLLVAAGLHAQTGTATISGRAVDTTGAVLPAAAVTVQSTDTGVVRSTQSNAEGVYSVPNLLPGNYVITAEFPGMKKLERSGLALRVGDRVTVDLTLEVGTQAQELAVSAEAALLRTDDAQSGEVIQNQRIQELPQYDRNALAFATLTANVNGTSEQMAETSDFRINGGRVAEAEYYMDGVPMSTGYMHNIPPSIASMEAVGEFKVITNGISAEYGRFSGGVVTLVTRSGSNTFHGGGYEFLRNDVLNANDWNSNRLGAKKGVFHDNVFGGTLGGPVRIPRVYNGQNKTFFFFNYEGVRHVSGTNSTLASVPTPLESSGNFSQSLLDNGKQALVADPLTGQVVNGQVVRQLFPGEIIPKSRFDPLSAIYLGYYPLPNTAPVPGTSHVNNYIGTSNTPYSSNQETLRLDQNWSARQSTRFSFNNYDYNSWTPRWLSDLQPSTVGVNNAYTYSVDHVFVVNASTVFELRGGLTRYVTRSDQVVASSINTSSWPIPANVRTMLGSNSNTTPLLQTDATNNNDYDAPFSLGGGGINDSFDTTYNAAASLQKLIGKHSLKFGYEHRRYYSNLTSGGSFNAATDRTITAQIPTQANNGNGPPFASWLLGDLTSGTGTQLSGPASLQTYDGAYVQDDIKFSNRLTLNIGIRWDMEPPRTERYNRQEFWDPNYKWPNQPDAGWSWSQVEQQIGQTLPTPSWVTNGALYGRVAMMGTVDYPERSMMKTHPHQLSPRVGGAYQLTTRTVLRAAWGINYATVTGETFLGGAPNNVGYGDLARLVQGGTNNSGLTYLDTFSNPMPGNSGYVPATKDVNTLNQAILGNWFLGNSTNYVPGYEHTVHFGIQREIGSGQNLWVLEVSYNGNFGRSIPYYLGQGLQILPDAYSKIGYLGNTLNTQVAAPFYGQMPAGSGIGGATLPLGRMYELTPLYQEVWTVGDPLGTSNYNAGYVQAEHRFANGFGFLANYTVSKLLTDAGGMQGQFRMPFPQGGMPVSSTYGLPTIDIAQKLLFNYSAELPFGRGKALLNNPQTGFGKALNQVIGGWVLAGTTTYRGGEPIQVTQPSSGVGGPSPWYNIGMGRAGQPTMAFPRVPYDNGVSGHAALLGSANMTPYTNAKAFQITTNFLPLGDCPVTMPNFRGPGFSQWDAALMKRFDVTERIKLQVRFEAQNVLNHMNAGTPGGSNQSLGTFGIISTQSGNPRYGMVAAKLNF